MPLTSWLTSGSVLKCADYRFENAPSDGPEGIHLRNKVGYGRGREVVACYEGSTKGVAH